MLAPMRLGTTATILALALGVGACGGDSSDGSSTTRPVGTQKSKPTPKITIGGVKASRSSSFVACLERAGFKVTFRPDARSSGVADVYYYDMGSRTPKEGEQIDRCSRRLVQPLRERVDQLGVARPEVQRIGKDQISIGLPGVKRGSKGLSERAVHNGSKSACASLGPQQMARVYGTESGPSEVAKAYADHFGSRTHRAAFLGCLAGFRSR
jgi:hypothetical protein